MNLFFRILISVVVAIFAIATGSSATFDNGDGTFSSFYQNVGFRSDMPIDAFGYILNNPEQLGKQLSSGGNLPDFAKAELLQASVHAGQYEFASHPVTKGAVNALTFIAPGGVSGVMALKNLGARLFTKAAVKGGAKLFGKEIATTTTRMGRDGKAVEIIFKDGSKIDINAARVKQWTPNTHPNAPAGTLQKVKFKNSIPGSKGYKRTPAQSELDFLNSL